MESHDDITLRIGESFAVRLELPGTSGYLWQAKEYGDEVQVVEEPRAKDERHLLPIGESVGQTFRITAAEPGEATVIFAMARPWESAEIANQHIVLVRVSR